MADETNAMDAIEIIGPGETVMLDAGEFLFHEGDPGQTLYIVKTGVVRVVSGSIVYETVRSGGIVGEMAIVDKGAERSASVIAGTRAELLEIDMPKFLALIASTPEFALEVMQAMARRLRVMNRRYRHDHP
jgi:CRP-like cAMP-binding protein